ncbi:MAG: peptide chain release factor 2 [Candidatus Staskawiczbacteria bacterium RIFCSPHIGHO2_01_FULL_34_27]|uniref:Peptide chain release factor 2 n=2 Tax=Candidatus Staskawicziibacteriota TaxID=1817916 RepID=A0A1G2HIR0_9BACT|nr:MAG: peptide chain release factor 2 [Candidatus Staskawiczbacteria bacterium RIFCSPHIGHO2_01_FULL_34_27]OGZ69027.1 MAG: peptide chain release factor 2 [Candidatus Staskawiczbacteria bacterium RIFCSPHIGHO2_02_FULL_34_9]
MSELKEAIERMELLNKEMSYLKELNGLIKDDENLIVELNDKFDKLRKDLEKEEFLLFLSGKYDKNNAILEISSGAGGQDSQDWATMLLRMYLRYSDIRGFKSNVLHQSFGEAGGPDGRIGTKSVTISIKGDHVYGFLKNESGIHRLVRISPFSTKKLRHTSFASVEVLPEIEEIDQSVEIKPDDLRIDAFKASGPGGQYVNKTESAIRITHLPTGIVVASQTERLQGRNKENAMKILRSKLHKLMESKHEKELKEIKGEGVSASWGNQIRSYVLHPYKMVKDLRTQYETSDVEAILDGKIDDFINAELKLNQ